MSCWHLLLIHPDPFSCFPCSCIFISSRTISCYVDLITITREDLHILGIHFSRPQTSLGLQFALYSTQLLSLRSDSWIMVIYLICCWGETVPVQQTSQTFPGHLQNITASCFSRSVLVSTYICQASKLGARQSESSLNQSHACKKYFHSRPKSWNQLWNN